MQKDEILDSLADRANVAQFVAFRPDPSRLPVQSYARLAGHAPNCRFDNVRAAIAALLAAAQERSVNIRSYEPESPRSREFIYGLTDADKVIEALLRLSAEGLHTIVNETIDVEDGGVSGVLQGDTAEFAPDDTPRCVEKPGVASMPLAFARRLLETVYGFEIPETFAGDRIEFSVHPHRRGTRRQHILLWERESGTVTPHAAVLRWPNRFSRHVGDKAFGLLVAHLLGQRVPETLVIGRRVAPFGFGTPTGLHENWFRTCPAEPVPGHFTTMPGWPDPFLLMAREDEAGVQISSVLNQAAVDARYSGATIVGPKGLVIEGRSGSGDAYMLGALPPEPLPDEVIAAVTHSYDELAAVLGPVRFEWVHDGKALWIVQLHVGATTTAGRTIVAGEPAAWVEFDIEEGLEALRLFTENLPSDTGVKLLGHVGATSHVADLLRRAGVPSKIS